ncbi:MAG: hypothetical protein AABX64_02600 [Nanoarchaeota archaeon]
MNQKLKYVLLGLGTGLLFFVVSGIITSLLPNSFFTRMTPINTLDYIFLASSSILLGAYVGVHYYKKNTIKKCDTIATTGGIGSFFAFACPICNKLLVFVFGATTLMTYFEPYRPILGFVSNGLLAGAVWWRIKR